jgi:hypothetical protein
VELCQVLNGVRVLILSLLIILVELVLIFFSYLLVYLLLFHKVDCLVHETLAIDATLLDFSVDA